MTQLNTSLDLMLNDANVSHVKIYVDGACSGNPGPGGWGALFLAQGHEVAKSGGESDTTNNRMELMGAIEALTVLPTSTPVTLITDSQYVKNGITSWINGWRKNGWINSKKEPVKNQDLWKRLDTLVQERKVEWEWVKGHSGNPFNDKVDMLAKRAIIALQVG